MSTHSAGEIGATVTISKHLSEADIALFLLITNELAPSGAEPPLTARHAREAAPLAMLGALLANAASGHAHVASGAHILTQTIRYCEPAYTDDLIVASARVTGVDEEAHALLIFASCENQEGRRLAEGELVLRAE